jgi:hypothetical protein
MARRKKISLKPKEENNLETIEENTAGSLDSTAEIEAHELPIETEEKPIEPVLISSVEEKKQVAPESVPAKYRKFL